MPFDRASVRRSDQGIARVGNLELFYDLVFVFAITQVSHHLLEHLTWEGAAQAALILLVVWWSWNYTTWATNELDPDSVLVRCLLIGVMLLSLLMAIAIPEAFGERALLFAGSYVAIQLTRTGFLAYAAAAAGTPERRRAERLVLWFVIAGVLWIAGALADGPLRTLLWVLALAFDYGGPLLTYNLPGLRRVNPADWDVSTDHFSERFQLFVIIALGETIVITGATTAELPLDGATVLAFALAFLGTAAIWWLYFDFVAKRLAHHLELAEGDRTQVARDIFTYGHVLVVAAVLLTAVGDELVIAHPDEALHGAELVAVVAGPVVYLVAHALLRLRAAGTPSWTRLAAAGGCVVIGVALGGTIPAVALSALLLAVLVLLIVRDARAAAVAPPRQAAASEGVTGSGPT